MTLFLARHFSSSARRESASLLGIYLVSRESGHLPTFTKRLNKLGFNVPVQHRQAVDGFGQELQESVLQHVDNKLVEPAALPPILVQDEWRRRWREQKKWYHVRRSREAPGRKHGGWLFDLDLTRGALGHALSHLQLWQEIANQGASNDAYLVLDDRCSFVPDFCSTSIDDKLAAVPVDWEIVFLGGCDLLGAQGRYEVAPGVLRLYPWFRAGPAYLIRISAARRIFNFCTPLRWRLDCHLTGYYASTLFGASSEHRLFGPTEKPIGYSLVPPLVEQHRFGGQADRGETAENEQRLMDELDAIIAWAMRLTDKPLPPGSIASIWHPDREIEGHTNMVPDAMKVINELAANPDVRNICEIGFNGGHSTLRWLLRSQAHVYSFDLGVHLYARPAAMWLMTKFPGRLTVTWGDSLTEVPMFFSRHPHIKCEIISIDGGHDYAAAKKDLEHLAPAAALPHNRILMDDTFLHEVKQAWDEMIRSGQVEELETYSGTLESGHSYGFAVGCYTGKCTE